LLNLLFHGPSTDCAPLQIDDVGDLARVTRSSRLFYYMTLPRLYEHVTLRSYSEIRYVDGRPEGYGNGSPFAMGLNTLVSRNFTDYIQSFRVVGDWREHDLEDYTKGRVPDNTMMLQIALRAALDKMKNLKVFAYVQRPRIVPGDMLMSRSWELSTKPMQTVYQSLIVKPSITSLTLRFQTKRIPRPTTVVPPLPNLRTLVVYDIDPLCYPDDISLLLAHAKKLENLKLHWNPRMRDSGEESVNLLQYFSRCIATSHRLPIKRMALYNLYARNSSDGFENCSDEASMEEVTVINCMSSVDPMTVFLDDTWRLSGKHPVPRNLKMMRGDMLDKENVKMMGQIHGIERLYLISNNKRKSSKQSSLAATPTTPSTANTPSQNGTIANGTPDNEHQCKGLAGDYLAVIQSNHRTMRHLLLSDLWVLSDDALHKLCQSCPDLEQLGFSCNIPPLELMRKIFALTPKLWAIRILARPGSELAEKLETMDVDMHEFALATELWKPEFRNVKYFGLGDKLIFKLGGIVFPPKSKNSSPIPPGQENSLNARRMGPIRRMTRVAREDVKHVEIWGLDDAEFDPKFP
jgi:hypothetical protein